MSNQKHIVFHVPSAWGHMKPLLAFVARIAEQRPESAVLMTVLTSDMMLQKIESELARMPGGVSERVNIIDIVGSTSGSPMTLPQFGPVFVALWHRQLVECISTKRTFVGLPRPTLAVISPFAGHALEDIRVTAGTACPILAWNPSTVSATLRLFGPENLGGLGDLQVKAAAEAAATGKPIAEIASSVFRKSTGEIVRVPGLPDAYDYESFPQEDHMPAAMVFLLGVHRFMLSTDGVIMVSSSAFEGESIAAGRQWLEGNGKDLYMVGPLENAPPSATLRSEPGKKSQPGSPEDAEVLAFLDRMHSTSGARSTLFIAFGSIHYPKNPAKLHALIAELLDKNVPFLWSHASPFAVVPPELAQRIDANDNAHHSRWVPQLAVLAHPATGWFINHGGWNSIQEALALRVPMIFWPFLGDQPSNAALMSLTHRAAFELLSVREGEGARPPLRVVQGGTSAKPIDFSIDGVRTEVRELLTLLNGVEGVRARENTEKLGAAMEQSWKDGGEARLQLTAFLEKYIDAA